MEPTNLNPPPSEDDQLAALLRANSPAVPDDGFSALVLTALPPPRQAARGTRPQIIAGILGALAGLGFALRKGASWSDGLEVAGRGIDACSALFSDPWFAFALGLTAVSLLIPYLLGQREGVAGPLKRPLGNGRFW